MFRGLALVLVLTVAAAGCKDKTSRKQDAQTVVVRPTADAGVASRTEPMRPPKITPPLPVDKPPADAETITGVEGAPRAVIYIKRLVAGAGEHPGRNDTVKLVFTGWRLNGETFLSTTVRKRPVTQSLAVLAPGFAVAVASMRKGERAMMWIPPELGYMGKPADTPETTVYEVELVDFERGPPTPADVAMAPANAKKTASGIPYIVVEPGSGKTRPRSYDVVTISYSAWSSTGRLFDSSEIVKQPKKTFPFREAIAVEEVLATMVKGQRVRLWLPASQLEQMPGTPDGQVCFEVELLEVQPKQAPPPTPRSVAAPPANAKKTANGVFYEVLKKGTGTVHPTARNRVKVNYTGWLTSGRLFDSSEVHGQPAGLTLSKAIPGFVEGMGEMVAGDRFRMWIPVELAYKGAPGSPPGMLVFEVELLEILQ